MNRKQRRHQKPKPAATVSTSTLFARETALRTEFKKTTLRIIKDTCDMYSISLAMVLSDKYNQSAEQIKTVLEAVDKLAEEFLEERLSIADCRRALIDETGIVIGEDALYVPMETADECEAST